MITTDTTAPPAPAALQETPILTATLKGTALQRGEQHGELFGRRVAESGILGFYRDYCHRHLGGGVLRTEALEAMHSFFAARLSAEARDLVRGYSRAAKIDPVEAARAAVMPDAMNFLTGLSGRLTGPMVLGGTSVAAWGDYTHDGRLLYGRNLDGPGQGLFDRSPLVCRHIPDSGQRYVTVATPGLVVDGLTGINEAGLTVALHQHVNAEVSRLPPGRSVADLGVRLLRGASSIEQAVTLAGDWKHSSAWSIVLTHGKTKRAVAIELTPKRLSVVEGKEGMLARTNTFQDPALRCAEIAGPALREGCVGRILRAEALLAQRRGRVDAGALAGLLGDHFDSERAVTRAFAQTIAQPHNLTSAVFDAEEGVVWLAERAACYRKVSLWSDEPAGQEALPSPQDQLSEQQREALESYQDATRSWEAGDETAALAALEKAAGLDPQDPAYRLLRGVLALRCCQPASAAESLEAGAALPDLPHRRDVQRLWQARALDLSGGRGEALKLYQDLGCASASAELRLAAVKGLEASYSGGPIRPDFFHADTYGY